MTNKAVLVTIDWLRWFRDIIINFTGLDNRLTTAETDIDALQLAPPLHASTHAAAGTDPLTLSQSQITNLVTDLSNKQPLDGDLTAIAALSTTGYASRTGANTWVTSATAVPSAHVTSHESGGSDVIFGGWIRIVSGEMRIGNPANSSDYLVVEADGTIRFAGAATTYVDVDFPVILKTTGVGNPTIATMQGNIQKLQWAINDAQSLESQEFTHPWKQASQVTWHVHFYTGALDATNRYVKWEIEYTWSNFNDPLPANTTISAEYMIPANTPALTHIIFDIGSFTPTNGRIAAHVSARLKRIAASGAAPSVDPFLDMAQLHIECDTVGSRNITTK